MTKATTLTTSKKDKKSGVVTVSDENGKLLTSTRRGFAIAFQSKTLSDLNKISPAIAKPFLEDYGLPESMTLFEAQQFIKMYIIVSSKDAKAVISAIDSNVDSIFGRVSEEMVQELPEAKIIDQYDVLDSLDDSEILKYMESRKAQEQVMTNRQLAE